ncbi:Transcriptional regulator of form adherence 6 [Cyberlindnera fabianii]|uniref:Transcriptional regulator of form adherence 6 n=1 Tax=Cyberlindnera fabianii TaxID=36022 RepID=A0A1V2L680_CYBFA|nr:Transcriptional regulator of form adherence 6 [Cyberlindnera fabianii]
MRIPSPPELKPTIIQMQSTDTTEESAVSDRPVDDAATVSAPASTQDGDQKTKKKRRRSSSSLVSQNEIEKRRREHKTAHSIIEKKRRIRMNREFEALKFLIPACRNNLNTSSNNGEGMYKLTILQSTVDYIRYLHSVINIQKSELESKSPEWAQEELQFAQVDVNTDDYRNLENDFNFTKLFEEYNNSTLQATTSTSSHATTSIQNASSNSLPSVSASATSLKPPRALSLPSTSYPSTFPNTATLSFPHQSDISSSSSTRSRASASVSTTTQTPSSQQQQDRFQSLPSPIITPELYPRASKPASTAGTSTNSLDITYQAQPFKQDFHFSLNPSYSNSAHNSTSQSPAIAPKRQQSNSFESLPSCMVTETPQQQQLGNVKNTSPRLEAIHEMEQDQKVTNAAGDALLRMKKDFGVTSIRSLLN